VGVERTVQGALWTSNPGVVGVPQWGFWNTNARVVSENHLQASAVIRGERAGETDIGLIMSAAGGSLGRFTNMSVVPRVEHLTSAQVRAIRNSSLANVEVLDLWSGERFRIFWYSAGGPWAGGHIDWSPMSPIDVRTIQRILNPNNDNRNWSQPSSWSWAARPIVVTINGRRIAAATHLFPHGSIVGGSPGAPLSSQSNTNPPRCPVTNARLWPVGGHMCMYFRDSGGGTTPELMRSLTLEAYRLANR